MMVTDVLGKGAGNAQTGRDICLIMNVSKRELTKAIERERRAGAPICANTSGPCPGYFLAGTREELARYCDSLKRRAAEIEETRAACMESIANIPESEILNADDRG